MNTYLITLVFQISIEGHRGAAQFDEQIRVIEANDDPEAWEKAQVIGGEEEEQFLNTHRQQVTWKFIAPTAVVQLNHLAHGDQVYSLTHEAEDAEIFADQVRQKSLLSQFHHTASVLEFE